MPMHSKSPSKAVASLQARHKLGKFVQTTVIFCRHSDLSSTVIVAYRLQDSEKSGYCLVSLRVVETGMMQFKEPIIESSVGPPCDCEIPSQFNFHVPHW